MKTTKQQKTFNAVKMMRKIREKISAETQAMKLDELTSYIKKHLAENKIKPVGDK
ncbi:MAG: hypothetical protein M3R17_21450 [Bacteroidota bacterium]|nr:hypothetical protein [Bacteroidota bacterium]